MRDSIRVLIVEDEFITSDSIQDELLSIGYQVSGQARSADEALRFLEKGDTDISILDIHIHGDKDGIELAGIIRERYNMPIVFLTAYSDKKTIDRATQHMPASYLVKPFKKHEIYAAMEIAIRQFNRNTEDASNTAEPEASEVVQGQPGTLFVKERHYFTKISCEDILYVHSSMKYLELFTTDKTYLIRQTFAQLIALLPSSDFIQPHRSFLVNKRHVERIGSSNLVVGGKEVPISLSKKAEVLQHFRMLK